MGNNNVIKGLIYGKNTIIRKKYNYKKVKEKIILAVIKSIIYTYYKLFKGKLFTIDYSIEKVIDIKKVIFL